MCNPGEAHHCRRRCRRLFEEMKYKYVRNTIQTCRTNAKKLSKKSEREKPKMFAILEKRILAGVVAAVSLVVNLAVFVFLGMVSAVISISISMSISMSIFATSITKKLRRQLHLLLLTLWSLPSSMPPIPSFSYPGP